MSDKWIDTFVDVYRALLNGKTVETCSGKKFVVAGDFILSLEPEDEAKWIESSGPDYDDLCSIYKED
jgi:hypothetical protein